MRDVPFVWVARRLGCPVFVKWHGSEIGVPAVRCVARVAIRWRIVCCAARARIGGPVVARKHRRSRARRDAPARVVVRNGLDLRRYAATTDVRTRLGVAGRVPLLLFIGRLLPAKGLLDVVEAMPASRRGTVRTSWW